MKKPHVLDAHKTEVDSVLAAVAHLHPSTREFILQACLKASRESRYFNRTFTDVEEWRPVLRKGYQQYLVSNRGFVRHKNKSELNKLRPAFGHEYARAPLKAVGRDGASQHMIHELVYESFVLNCVLPEDCRDQKSFEVINHLDGDKYNPSLANLESTDQGKNMLHAYLAGLRKPRT